MAETKRVTKADIVKATEDTAAKARDLEVLTTEEMFEEIFKQNTKTHRLIKIFGALIIVLLIPILIILIYLTI